MTACNTFGDYLLQLSTYSSVLYRQEDATPRWLCRASDNCPVCAWLKVQQCGPYCVMMPEAWTEMLLPVWLPWLAQHPLLASLLASAARWRLADCPL